MSKTYYGPPGSTTNEYRLSPSPQITISTEPYYSGDIIIGYTHNVSIRGYASAYRRTTNTDPAQSVTGLGLVADSIATVKKILSRNGSELVVQENNGTNTIKCKGGTLRSISFNESTNNWMGFSEYSATIEFNEIELINGSSLKTIACSESYLNSSSKSNSIIDINKYKIKAFTDNWSISVEEDLYSRVINNDISQNISTENSAMTVSYTISATGKNHYINQNLIPAWEQAKNFVQDRLFNKVNNLLTSTLGKTADTACAATSSLGAIGSSTDGILNNLNTTYGIYNETISCTTSESDGTFSVTYNAIIKKNNTSDFNHPASKHTFNKTITKQNENNKITTISIQGTIEGMVEGGIIRANATGFKLPQNGSILSNSSTKTKYSEALAALNKLIDNNDLKISIKNKLGINNDALGLVAGAISGCPSNPNGPPPSSFNLTHNYHEGTINYSIEYNSNNVCGQIKEYAITSVAVENSVPILAEFPLPRTGVLIIQDIGTKTAKKITINIEGKKDRMCCLDQNTLSSEITNLSFVLPTGLTLPDPNMFILTQKQRTNNIIDGSFSISLAYICATGCTI